METISVFPVVKKFAGLRWKKTGVSRTQGVCHVIHIYFVSSLDKV